MTKRGQCVEKQRRGGVVKGKGESKGREGGNCREGPVKSVKPMARKIASLLVCLHTHACVDC